MSKSWKKKVEQLVRKLISRKLNPQEFQHRRRCGFAITESELLTEEKIGYKKTRINILVGTTEIVKLLAILAAFGAFALTMRQKEFDRFSLVKPLFEIEQLDNKNDDSKLKLKLLNHGGLVYFTGCKDNKINKEKLEKTPRRYSSLSKRKSVRFLLKNNINKDDYFTCYYRDIDENLYKLEIVYKKTSNTDTYSFRIDRAPFVYRSNLFVTTSRELLDKVVNCIFPKDWYSKHEELKDEFKDECLLNEKNKIDISKIDSCLLVRSNNLDIKD